MSDINQRSVVFNGNNLYFDLIHLDIADIIQKEPKFQDLFDASGINTFDAIADILIEVTNFDNLFMIGIAQQDIQDNSSNSIFYALDGSAWNNGHIVNFSNAIVRNEYAINKNLNDEKQKVKFDFIRYLLKEITNSLKLNTLFRNKEQLYSAVSSLDSILNSSINTKLNSLGGTIDNPMSNADISNNPVRILFNSILSDRTDNLNNSRRELLLQRLDTQLNDSHNEAKAKKFYVQGTSNNQYGYYYPLYTHTSHSDLVNGYQIYTFSDVFLNIKFYMPNDNQNNAIQEGNQDLTDLENYMDTYITYVSIPLIEGDRLGVNITYNPNNNEYLGKNINSRSYKIYLQMRDLGDVPLGETYPLDGTAQQAYISDAIVTIFDIAGNVIGTTSTDETGKFNFEFQSNPGVVKLDISGGVNTATGNPNTMKMKWVGDAADAEKDANVSVATTIVTSMFETAVAAAAESGDSTVNIADTSSLLESIDIAKTKMAVAFNIPKDSIDGDYLETKDTKAAAANIKLKSFINLISDAADGGAESVIDSVASLVESVDTTTVDASNAESATINILDAADTITLVSEDISLNQLKSNAETVVSFVESLATVSESEQIQMLETVNYAVEQSIQQAKESADVSGEDVSGGDGGGLGGGGGGAFSLVLDTTALTTAVNDASNVVVMSNLFPSAPPPTKRMAMIHALCPKEITKLTYYQDDRYIFRDLNYNSVPFKSNRSGIPSDSSILVSLYDASCNRFSKRYVWTDRYIQDELWRNIVVGIKTKGDNLNVYELANSVSEVELNVNWSEIHSLNKERGNFILVQELENSINSAHSKLPVYSTFANKTETHGNTIILFTSLHINSYGVEVINRYIHPIGKTLNLKNGMGNSFKKLNDNLFLLSKKIDSNSQEGEKTLYNAFFFVNGSGNTIKYLDDYGSKTLNIESYSLEDKTLEDSIETRSSWRSLMSDSEITEFNGGDYFVTVGIGEGLAGLNIDNTNGNVDNTLLDNDANYNKQIDFNTSKNMSIGIRIFRSKWNFDNGLFDFKNITSLDWSNNKHEILVESGNNIIQDAEHPLHMGRIATKCSNINKNTFDGIEIPVSGRFSSIYYDESSDPMDFSLNGIPNENVRKYSIQEYPSKLMIGNCIRKLNENRFIFGYPMGFLQIIDINITGKNNYTLTKKTKHYLDIWPDVTEENVYRNFKSFDILSISSNVFVVVTKRLMPDSRSNIDHKLYTNMASIISESSRTDYVTCLTSYYYDDVLDKIVELTNMPIFSVNYDSSSNIHNDIEGLFKLHKTDEQGDWFGLVFTYDFKNRKRYATFRVKNDGTKIKLSLREPGFNMYDEEQSIVGDYQGYNKSAINIGTNNYFNSVGMSFGEGCVIANSNIVVASKNGANVNRTNYYTTNTQCGELLITIPRGKRKVLELDTSEEIAFPTIGLEKTVLGKVMAQNLLYDSTFYGTTLNAGENGLLDLAKGKSVLRGNRSTEWQSGRSGVLFFKNTKTIDLDINPILFIDQIDVGLGRGNYVINYGGGPRDENGNIMTSRCHAHSGNTSGLETTYEVPDRDHWSRGTSNMIGWGWSLFDMYDEENDDILWMEKWDGYKSVDQVPTVNNFKRCVDIKPSYGWHSLYGYIPLEKLKNNQAISTNVNDVYRYRTGKSALSFWESRYDLGTKGLNDANIKHFYHNRLWVEIKLPEKINPTKIKIWPGNNHWYHFPKHFEIYACNSSPNDGKPAIELFHEHDFPKDYNNGINPFLKPGSWGTTIFSYKEGDAYNYWQQAEDWFQHAISYNNLRDSGGGTGGYPFNSDIPGNPDLSLNYLMLDSKSVGWQLPADSTETFNTFRFQVIINNDDEPLSGSRDNYIKIGGIRYFGYTEKFSEGESRQEILSTMEEWKERDSYKIPFLHVPRPKFPTTCMYAYKSNEDKLMIEPIGTTRNKQYEEQVVSDNGLTQYNPAYQASTYPPNVNILKQFGGADAFNGPNEEYENKCFKYRINDISGVTDMSEIGANIGFTSGTLPDDISGAKFITLPPYSSKIGAGIKNGGKGVKQDNVYYTRYNDEFTSGDDHGVQLYVPRGSLYDIDFFVLVPNINNDSDTSDNDTIFLKSLHEEYGYNGGAVIDDSRNIDEFIDAGFTKLTTQPKSYGEYVTWSVYKKKLHYKDVPVSKKYTFDYPDPSWCLINPGKMRVYNYEVEPIQLLDTYGFGNESRDTVSKMPVHIDIPNLPVLSDGSNKIVSSIDIGSNLTSSLTPNGNMFIAHYDSYFPKYYIHNLTSFNNPYNISYKRGNTEFWNGVILPPKDMTLRFRCCGNRDSKVQCYIHKSNSTGPVTWSDVKMLSGSNTQYQVDVNNSDYITTGIDISVNNTIYNPPLPSHEFIFTNNIGSTTITDTYDFSINIVAVGDASCNVEGMKLDGSGNYLDMTPYRFGGAFTMEAYFKLNELNDTNLIEFGNFFKITTGSTSQIYLDSSSNIDISSSLSYSVDEWTHVVFVVDSSYNVKAYKNGLLTSDVNVDISVCHLERPHHYIGENMNGVINRVRFWHDVLLTDLQVKSLYTNPVISGFYNVNVDFSDNIVYGCDASGAELLSVFEFMKENPDFFKVASFQVHDHDGFTNIGDNVELNDKGRIYDESNHAYTFKANELYSILVVSQHYGINDNFRGKLDVWWSEDYLWFDEDRGLRGTYEPKRKEFPSYVGTDAYLISSGPSASQIIDISNESVEKYYLLGTGIHGYGYYYPLYINEEHVDLSGGYNIHIFSDVYTNITFYMPLNNINMAIEVGSESLIGLVNYSSFHNLYYPNEDIVETKLSYQYPVHESYVSTIVQPSTEIYISEFTLTMDISGSNLSATIPADTYLLSDIATSLSTQLGLNVSLHHCPKRFIFDISSNVDISGLHLDLFNEESVTLTPEHKYILLSSDLGSVQFVDISLSTPMNILIDVSGGASSTLTIPTGQYFYSDVATLFSNELGITVTYSDVSYKKLIFNVTDTIDLSGLDMNVFNVENKTLTTSDNELRFYDLPLFKIRVTLEPVDTALILMEVKVKKPDPEPEPEVVSVNEFTVSASGWGSLVPVVDGLRSAYNFTSASDSSVFTDLMGNSTGTTFKGEGTIHYYGALTYGENTYNSNEGYVGGGIGVEGETITLQNVVDDETTSFSVAIWSLQDGGVNNGSNVNNNAGRSSKLVWIGPELINGLPAEFTNDTNYTNSNNYFNHDGPGSSVWKTYRYGIKGLRNYNRRVNVNGYTNDLAATLTIVTVEILSSNNKTRVTRYLRTENRSTYTSSIDEAQTLDFNAMNNYDLQFGRGGSGNLQARFYSYAFYKNKVLSTTEKETLYALGPDNPGFTNTTIHKSFTVSSSSTYSYLDITALFETGLGLTAEFKVNPRRIVFDMSGNEVTLSGLSLDLFTVENKTLTPSDNELIFVEPEPEPESGPESSPKIRLTETNTITSDITVTASVVDGLSSAFNFTSASNISEITDLIGSSTVSESTAGSLTYNGSDGINGGIQFSQWKLLNFENILDPSITKFSVCTWIKYESTGDWTGSFNPLLWISQHEYSTIYSETNSEDPYGTAIHSSDNWTGNDDYMAFWMSGKSGKALKLYTKGYNGGSNSLRRSYSYGSTTNPVHVVITYDSTLSSNQLNMYFTGGNGANDYTETWDTNQGSAPNWANIISAATDLQIGNGHAFTPKSRWYTYSFYKNHILSSSERETLYNLGYENPGLTTSNKTITINPNTYTMVEIASLFSSELGINVTYSDEPENKLVFDISDNITLTGLSLEIFRVQNKILTSTDNELLFVFLEPVPEPDHEFMFHGATTLDGLADTYDSSITVTNNGATLSANGAVFDGVDDYLDLTPWEFGGEISIEIYINIAEMTVEPAIVSLGSDNWTDSISLGAGNHNGNIVFRRRPGGNCLSSTNAASETNTWIHIVATLDSASAKIYKNGALDTTFADSTALPATATRSDYSIGKSMAADLGYSGRYFKGTVAYVRIWHGTVLDATQVSTLYNNRPDIIIPTPTHSWEFRNQSGQSTITDSIDGTSLMSFYDNGSSATLPNNTGATLTGTEYLVTNQAEIFEAPYTIEVYLRQPASPAAFSRIIGVAPSGDNWGSTYGYAVWVHGTTNMAWVHGGSIFQSGGVEMKITDVFPTGSPEDMHIVLSVDSGSMTWYCKSASTSTSLTYPTTDQSTHQNASRYISLGTEAASLTNFLIGDYYYLRVWNGTALNADEVERLYTHREQIGWDAIVAAGAGVAPPPPPPPDHEFMFQGATTLDGLVDTYDSSITVTNNGATLSSNGAVFDGVDDYLDLTPWEFGGSMTVETYINISETDVAPAIFEFGDEHFVDSVGLFSENSSDTFIFRRTPPQLGRSLSSDNASSETNTWIHIVTTLDMNSDVIIYINGQVDSTSTHTMDLPDEKERTYHSVGRSLGALIGGTGRFFNGTIAYLRFWHGTTLDATQVSTLYDNRHDFVTSSIVTSSIVTSSDNYYTLKNASALYEDHADGPPSAAIDNSVDTIINHRYHGDINNTATTAGKQQWFQAEFNTNISNCVVELYYNPYYSNVDDTYIIQILDASDNVYGMETFHLNTGISYELAPSSDFLYSNPIYIDFNANLNRIININNSFNVNTDVILPGSLTLPVIDGLRSAYNFTSASDSSVFTDLMGNSTGTTFRNEGTIHYYGNLTYGENTHISNEGYVGGGIGVEGETITLENVVDDETTSFSIAVWSLQDTAVMNGVNDNSVQRRTSKLLWIGPELINGLPAEYIDDWNYTNSNNYFTHDGPGGQSNSTYRYGLKGVRPWQSRLNVQGYTNDLAATFNVLTVEKNSTNQNTLITRYHKTENRDVLSDTRYFSTLNFDDMNDYDLQFGRGGSGNLQARFYSYAFYKNKILSTTEKETLYDLGPDNPGVINNTISFTIPSYNYSIGYLANIFSKKLGVDVSASIVPLKLIFNVSSSINISGLSLDVFTVESKTLTSSDNELLFVDPSNQPAEELEPFRIVRIQRDGTGDAMPLHIHELQVWIGGVNVASASVAGSGSATAIDYRNYGGTTGGNPLYINDDSFSHVYHSNGSKIDNWCQIQLAQDYTLSDLQSIVIYNRTSLMERLQDCRIDLLRQNGHILYSTSSISESDANNLYIRFDGPDIDNVSSDLFTTSSSSTTHIINPSSNLYINTDLYEPIEPIPVPPILFRKVRLQRDGSISKAINIHEFQIWVGGVNVAPAGTAYANNVRNTSSTTRINNGSAVAESSNLFQTSDAQNNNWCQVRLSMDYDISTLQSIVIYNRGEREHDRPGWKKDIQGCRIDIMEDNNTIIFSTDSLSESDANNLYIRFDGPDINNVESSLFTTSPPSSTHIANSSSSLYINTDLYDSFS